MAFVSQSELRSQFALALSELYGREVPAYTTLLEVSQEVNRDFVEANPDTAHRLGSVQRVTAERHGAIRVGSTQELAQVARVFGALGMYPVGFYDLREAKPNPIPVVSTAFRPVERGELSKNPFRVFTSMLVPEDRRFFSIDLESQLKKFISARSLFSDELLEVADRSIANGELSRTDAARFLDLATAAFALSPEPVDRSWYESLDAVSSVAADIGGVASTHINHLTPRVLDIDELFRRMTERGIQMIDEIQGPPCWEGPDLLLRQTSFRALAEPRAFREADGRVEFGDLRVRFGEVEARGLALTEDGRIFYDQMVSEVDTLQTRSQRNRSETTHEVWSQMCPRSERALLERDYCFFNFAACTQSVSVREMPMELLALIDSGYVTADPIVYEDFLPRSAAGIFASNLSGDGSVDPSKNVAERDMQWMSEMIGVPIFDPYALYSAERQESFEVACSALGLDPKDVKTPWGTN